VRIFTNYEVPDISALLGMKKTLLDANVELHLNKSGPADLVLVLNANKSLRWVFAPRNRIYKFLQEPVVRSPLTHLFTYRHPRFFSKVYTHSPNPSNSREIKSHGFLGSELVGDTELSEFWPSKTKLVSIVASTIAILPGHKRRLEFVERLIRQLPHLENDLYGRGRKKELTRKIDGLRDYMFSIAIENTATPSYITEKFTDCIRAGVVPLYFGASDVGDYFPEGSFIRLPLENEKECLKIIGDLSAEDYESRRQAILDAQKIIESNFSLGSYIASTANDILREPGREGRVFISLFGIDGVLLRLSETVGFVAKFIPSSIKVRLSGILYPKS
jgi:hypothetical protein